MRVLKPILSGTFLSLAISTMTVVAAGQGTQPQQPLPKSPDITVTGCLIQGSDPTVFLLDNARIDPKDANEAAKKYVITSTVEDQPLKTLVDHEVTATGILLARADAKPIPNPPTETEKDLPVLSAKTLATVADRCTNAGR